MVTVAMEPGSVVVVTIQGRDAELGDAGGRMRGQTQWTVWFGYQATHEGFLPTLNLDTERETGAYKEDEDSAALGLHTQVPVLSNSESIEQATWDPETGMVIVADGADPSSRAQLDFGNTRDIMSPTRLEGCEAKGFPILNEVCAKQLIATRWAALMSSGVERLDGILRLMPSLDPATAPEQHRRFGGPLRRRACSQQE